MDKKDKTFDIIIKEGKKYSPNTGEVKILKKLPPGCYKTIYDFQTKNFYFQSYSANCDNIIDLPSPEYKRLTSQMTHFLKPETREKFKEKGFLYKRSALLEGLPGTGKSILINRVISDVIKANGIVLYADNPQLIRLAFDILDDIQPNTTTLVVLEEWDELIENHGQSGFLELLDGQIQKQNVMYLAATNYINKIPKRLIRPGRISSVIKVNYPNKACRYQYFSMKMGESFKDLNLWTDSTEGLSVDELKEVVQSVYIFEDDLNETISRIKSTRLGKDDLEKDDENWNNKIPTKKQLNIFQQEEEEYNGN